MALQDIGARAVIKNVDTFNRGVQGMQSRMGKFTQAVKANSQSFKKAGLALSAFAAAGILLIKKLTSVYLEQRNALRVLAATIELTGISFDSVKTKILETTAALQRKTSIGDEAQIRILNLMVPILGDVDKALAALPAVLDASAASGLAASSVASTLTRALAGQINQARSVGIQFEKTADFTERLSIVLAKVGGAAEANADPLTQLGNTAGDLAEVMGKAMLPAVTFITNKLMSLFEAMQRVNPTFLRIVGTAFVAATAFAAIGGPMLLLIGFLPHIAAGWTLISGAMAAASTVMTGTLIPALLRVITSMWALVAARVAALAALGPVGWAILAGSVGVAAAGIAALVMKSKPNLPSFAEGGTMIRSGLAVVGERGPEVVALPGGATVTPITNNTTYSVTAHYARSQAPQSIRLDLEALAMSAGR